MVANDKELLDEVALNEDATKGRTCPSVKPTRYFYKNLVIKGYNKVPFSGSDFIPHFASLSHDLSASLPTKEYPCPNCLSGIILGHTVPGSCQSATETCVSYNDQNHA